MARLRVEELTDAGCPFAWSAEPARRRAEVLVWALEPRFARDAVRTA